MTTNNLSNQIATITPSESEFNIIREQAASLVKTGFLPVAIKTPEQALAIILTGRELGIPAMTAINGINVIQGKPTISPQLMLGLIERSGQLEDIRFKVEDDAVSVMMKRRGRTAHTEIFGAHEAHAMGLLSKDNYKKQASTMYKWRAVSACARVVFPDVLLGLYTHEEIAPDSIVNEDGELILMPEDAVEIEIIESAAELRSHTVATLEETVEPEPKRKAKKAESTKKAKIAERLSKEDWVKYCGNGFRALNSLGTGPKWNLESINEMIETEFGVEGGGIHNLDLAQLERLAGQLDNWYITLTEGISPEPEAV